MKIRQSFEQAICILLLIGASESPIKSHELSDKLDVSDSYLKKVDHLNKAEEQYKAKLREITLDHILSAAHSI